MAREQEDVSAATWRARECVLLAKRASPHAPHVCEESLEYVETDGALGQAWYCATCGALVQVG